MTQNLDNALHDLNMSNDEFMKQIDRDFLSGFTGVPVRIDPELHGHSFYCAVSEEVFGKLKGLTVNDFEP